MKPIVRNASTHYFACSDKAAKWLFSKDVYQKKQYYLIKNAIDTERYKYNSMERESLRHQYGLEGKFIVGHVGRFNEQKNHKYLIDIDVYKRQRYNSASFIRYEIPQDMYLIKTIEK